MSEDVSSKVKKIVADHLGIDEAKVTEESSFIDDLGADSLDTVELVMAFEEEFGSEISDSEAEKILTVGDAVKFIEGKANQQFLLMPTSNDGIMVILSSPSGAGKTTLVKLLSKENNFELSTSHTTRMPRPNQVSGKDYYFVSDQEFKRLIKNEEFLEYAKVFNNYYGTTRTPVIDNLNKGKNVLFDIDWQGADQIKNKNLDFKLITFFILPPSKQILYERLSNRDMKDKLIAEERMKQFERDVLHWINYNYVVINDDLNSCYNKIKNLISAELNNGSKDYDIEYIRNHVENLTS